MDQFNVRDAWRDDIKGAIREVLEERAERARIDSEEHAAHHAYVANLIEREQVRRERMEVLMRQVFGWGLVAAIGWVGKWVLQHISFGLSK